MPNKQLICVFLSMFLFIFPGVYIFRARPCDKRTLFAVKHVNVVFLVLRTFEDIK